MTGHRMMLSVAIVTVFGLNLNAEQSEPVVFDVPAAVQAVELAVDEPLYGTDKVVEVVIPVSSQIEKKYRGNVDEFRYEIFWNRSVYPLVDYGPRTITASSIEGTISIEERHDKNANIGVNLSSGYKDYATGTANAQLGTKSGETRRYQEVPQFDVLVASGTVRRGTGAFFRFHPSKKESLEGGRDLVVAFRVPMNWRGGVLQVHCHADGKRAIIGSWGEDISVGKSFVVPVYLQGDDQARDIATEFVQREQSLRSSWTRYQTRSKKSGINVLFTLPESSDLPEHWAHHLIQSGTDSAYKQYHEQLPSTLRIAATDFIQIRRELVALSL